MVKRPLVLALRTSDPVCHVYVNGREFIWEAGRSLAHGLLGFLEECLTSDGYAFADVTGLIVFRGSGSFTGLRIGITVMNTIAGASLIPIVGQTGDDWLEAGQGRLRAGESDQIVLPEYGGDAHITLPKK